MEPHRTIDGHGAVQGNSERPLSLSPISWLACLVRTGTTGDVNGLVEYIVGEQNTGLGIKLSFCAKGHFDEAKAEMPAKHPNQFVVLLMLPQQSQYKLLR